MVEGFGNKGETIASDNCGGRQKWVGKLLGKPRCRFSIGDRGSGGDFTCSGRV